MGELEAMENVYVITHCLGFYAGGVDPILSMC